MPAYSLDGVHWLTGLWLLALPITYWLALRWTNARYQSIGASLTLMLSSLGIGMALFIFLSPNLEFWTNDPVAKLRELAFRMGCPAEFLVLGSAIAGAISSYCSGWRAAVLALMVGVWGLFWVAPVWVLLWMLGG